MAIFQTRNKIRTALGKEALTISDVCRKTGLSPKIVSTNLSAMKLRTKEVIYTKNENDSYGRYKLIELNTNNIIVNIDLKLSQLRTHYEQLRRIGISEIDSIINDYKKLNL